MIRTLTNSAGRPNPFRDWVEVHPFHFDDGQARPGPGGGQRPLQHLLGAVQPQPVPFRQGRGEQQNPLFLRGRGGSGTDRPYQHHQQLARFPLEYFRGKARLKEELRSADISHAILRPDLLFGKEDILINNIAWVLRHFPVFAVFGDGSYRLQPIFVDDLARLAVEQGGKTENTAIKAIGPGTYTFRGLVQEIGREIGKRRPVFHVPPRLGYWLGSLLGRMKGDVLLTREKMRGVMAELLYVDAPPAGQTRLSDWMRRKREWLGKEYRRELKRRLDREIAYTTFAN